jgi:hypothetical protein
MRTWGRIPVRDTPMASCGAPASQTHISTAAGNVHKSYTMNAGKKGLGSRAKTEKENIAASPSKL